MADNVEAGPPAPPQRRLPTAALVASGLVAGLVLAGLTTANAQSGPTPSPSPSAAPGDQPPPRGHRMKHGPGLHGLGRGVLHGEFVTEDPAGGYRTMAVQQGEATAVSATSITVRSADGYSRTYAVGEDTAVHSANDGIGDVRPGDRVHLMAVVSGDTATAIRIADVSERDRLRDKWRGPRRGGRAPAPTPSPS